ncbi:MAG: transcriptional regulator, partial [Firmicutes bacterium]|nr:transcriptional regulator [Bacillota bacterium]
MSIAHANKDIVSKVLNQNYKNKSFKVYGLDLPKIKQMLPTDYPVISSEYRGDGAFLLEDDSLLLQEYESSARNSNFIKYLQYILALTKALASEGIKITNVIVAVIYTGDILTAPSVYDLGAVRITIKQVFLSKFDTAAIYSDIKAKISQKQQLTDEDVMRLIILPLTQPIKAEKQGLIEDTVNLAKQVDDDEQQRFILAGILTATDKFINRDYANQIMEMMNMTKVEQLFEEKFRAKYKAEQELEREKWLQE